MVETCLQKILVARDVPGAVTYVKTTIADLLMNRMDLSLLVITKGLTQEVEDYDNRAAHVELARKMKLRDPATAPAVGDRIPYVIVKAAKGVKAYEKSEDPIYALENNLPIDCQHYLEHYLSKPLLRIFEPILKNAERELLQGDHTRSISQPTPTAAGGGIMRFAKARALRRAALRGGSSRTRHLLRARRSASPASAAARPSRTRRRRVPSACTAARARRMCIRRVLLCELCFCGGLALTQPASQQRSLVAVNELQETFGRLWTQCQRCQCSMHQDVLCTSRDCPIFYRCAQVWEAPQRSAC